MEPEASIINGQLVSYPPTRACVMPILQTGGHMQRVLLGAAVPGSLMEQGFATFCDPVM